MIETVTDRSIPKYLVNRNMKLELSGIAALYEKDFASAEEYFRKQYRLLAHAQRKTGRTIHKGAPLYNWGVALVNEGRPDEGFPKIAAAYIEDLLTEGKERARSGLAFELLTRLGLPEEIKKETETAIWQRLASEQDVSDPVTLADKYMTVKDHHIDFLAYHLPFKRRPQLEKFKIVLSGPPDKRVFIGGLYKNIVVLTRIVEIVAKQGYYPQLVGEILKDILKTTAISKEDMREICFEILEECKYAIFEATFDGGHYVEIERCSSMLEKGVDIEVLILLQPQYPDPARGKGGTSMICDPKFDIEEYGNLRKLPRLVRGFLSENK